MKTFFVISNYNNDTSWVPQYTDSYYIYDRSDIPHNQKDIDQSKIIRQPNVGYNLYDYLTFIIDHYDTLPSCIAFLKGNVFPRHVTQDYFTHIITRTTFTPLVDRTMHTPRPPRAFFSSRGGYAEINTSWYLKKHTSKFFHSYNDFLRFIFKKPNLPFFVHFAPGANYIVPKENILKYPKVFYENLRRFISYTTLPGEAHILERALYTIWSTDKKPSEAMLQPIPEKFKGVPKSKSILTCILAIKNIVTKMLQK